MRYQADSESGRELNSVEKGTKESEREKIPVKLKEMQSDDIEPILINDPENDQKKGKKKKKKHKKKENDLDESENLRLVSEELESRITNVNLNEEDEQKQLELSENDVGKKSKKKKNKKHKKEKAKHKKGEDVILVNGKEHDDKELINKQGKNRLNSTDNERTVLSLDNEGVTRKTQESHPKDQVKMMFTNIFSIYLVRLNIVVVHVFIFCHKE